MLPIYPFRYLLRMFPEWEERQSIVQKGSAPVDHDGATREGGRLGSLRRSAGQRLDQSRNHRSRDI